MAFFSDSNLESGFQPKRKFRFTVHFTKLGGDLVFMAKTATKPSYSLESTAHRFLNHEFKFPNIIQWQDVTVSFIDAVEPNVGSKFYNVLLNQGYLQPTSVNSGFSGGVTKMQTVNAIGDVWIRQLDGGIVLNGDIDPGNLVGAHELPQIVEEWRLKNAFITSCKFGDGLDYGSDDLVTVDLTLRYDFAELATNLGGMT